MNAWTSPMLIAPLGVRNLVGDADSKHLGQRTGEYPPDNMGDENQDRR